MREKFITKKKFFNEISGSVHTGNSKKILLGKVQPNVCVLISKLFNSVTSVFRKYLWPLKSVRKQKYLNTSVSTSAKK